MRAIGTVSMQGFHGPAGWSDLPLDVLLQLPPLLDEPSLAAARAVCKSWRDAVSYGVNRLRVTCVERGGEASLQWHELYRLYVSDPGFPLSYFPSSNFSIPLGARPVSCPLSLSKRTEPRRCAGCMQVMARRCGIRPELSTGHVHQAGRGSFPSVA